MAKFIQACDCPQCGRLCRADGIVIDFTTEESVISLNLFSYTDWHCNNCNIDFEIGDINDFIEEV